jgi:hypothetical protein
MSQSDRVFADGLFYTEKENSYGKIGKLAISVDKFIEFLNEHKDERGYVRVDILERREPTEDKTHYGILNTYKPKQESSERPRTQAPKAAAKKPAQPRSKAPVTSEEDPFDTGF